MNSMDKDIDHVLVTEEQMKAKVAELGAQISRDYAGKDLLRPPVGYGCIKCPGSGRPLDRPR